LVSINNWKVRKQNEDLNFYYVEDPASVVHVFNKHTARRADAPMYVTLEGSICLLDPQFDIGRYFNLKHWRGVAVGGWTQRVMWILANTLNPATKRVRLDCLDVTGLISTNFGLLEGLMDIQLGGSWYNSPEIPSDPATVEAFEYWDMRFPWSDFPLGTTLTAVVWGAVPSGVSLAAHIYDVDSDTVVATDPTPFTSTSFSMHSFAIPPTSADKRYRLRAVVTGGSGEAVFFKGLLRPNLP
jgi:hypothetical protein